MRKAVSLVFLASLMAFSYAEAGIDFVQSIDSDTSNTVNFSLSTANFYLGQLPAYSEGQQPSQLVIYAGDTTSELVRFGLICSSSPTTLTGCSGAWASGAIQRFTPAGGYDLPSTPALLTFSSTTMPAYESGMYYFLNVGRESGTAGTVTLKGNNTASSTCIAGCVVNSGQPYYVVSSGSSTVPWDSIYFPTVYSTSSAAIAASSSLWGAYASTSNVESTCVSGNIFTNGICVAFSYLFVPNPNVLSDFADLPGLMMTKFPFSWVSDVKSVVTSQNAASTQAMTAYSFDLTSLGIGTSTSIGNILPSYVGFSSTTVTQYIGLTVWNLGQALMAAVLWLGLGYDIYATVRRRHAHV